MPENEQLPPTQKSGAIPQPHGGALTPFQPGVSGNPGGRPIRKPMTDAYTKLGDMSPEDREAYVPKTTWEERAKAMHLAEGVMVAKELADRVEGKAVDTVIVQGNLGELAAIASRRGDPE